MGSWGARFIDVLESYSRNRSRSAVVDATGINDFEDTPLMETIEALIEDEDRATLAVGVIGVWTNVKIHYLLYDLKGHDAADYFVETPADGQPSVLHVDLAAPRSGAVELILDGGVPRTPDDPT